LGCGEEYMAVITTKVPEYISNKPAPQKAKTLTQAIDDIKKEAVAWGGEIVSEKVYESGGRMRQIEVKMVFKVH
jgi:hypothetical protein